MRVGYDTGILKNKKKNLTMAVYSGSDFVSEHEWGISSIKKRFNMPDRATCIQDTRIDGLLCFDDSVLMISTRVDFIHRNIEYHCRDSGYSSEWDDRNFCIKFSQDEEKSYFDLKDSYEKNSLHLMFQKYNDEKINFGHFDNEFSGWMLVCYDKLPYHIKTQFEEFFNRSNDNAELLANWKEESGFLKVREQLKEQGKKWFYLDARLNANREPVIWLNPQDQKNHNFGGVTVKDLEDWLEDKGKIIDQPS